MAGEGGGEFRVLASSEPFSPEPGRLCMDAGGEVGAAHAVREARIVLDPRARPCLSAWSERLASTAARCTTADQEIVVPLIDDPNSFGVVVRCDELPDWPG